MPTTLTSILGDLDDHIHPLPEEAIQALIKMRTINRLLYQHCKSQGGIPAALDKQIMQILNEQINAKGKVAQPAKQAEWEDFIEEIDEILECEDYNGWADDTLIGIRDTVIKTRRVTDGQTRAVANIGAKVLR